MQLLPKRTSSSQNQSTSLHIHICVQEDELPSCTLRARENSNTVQDNSPGSYRVGKKSLLFYNIPISYLHICFYHKHER